jgi:hypothetical protein
MVKKERFDIECPCDKKRTFPIVLQYEKGKLQGSTSQEIECPFCENLLTLELPGTVVKDTGVIRGISASENPGKEI